ncbi:MAG: response regulator [Eubacteriales bacterium]|nr:response regulator [Eubacteriales bacterium]
MRLMIVDDEVFAIQGIMDGVNWEVLPFQEIRKAGSYTQAVELLSKETVDVLLCDIEMPDESGLELIDWVNAHCPDTVCMILSCHDEFDFARQAVRLQCFDYILKPVRYEALTQALQRACGEWKDKHRQAQLEGYGQIYIDAMTGGGSREAAEDVVDKVAAYIDTHLAGDLSVRTLAGIAYVSPDHLTRSFKKRFQKTVSDYVTEKRMALAGELLRRRGMTVTMVSDYAGFGNYSYFTEQFKKWYGMTPREYQARERR